MDICIYQINVISGTGPHNEKDNRSKEGPTFLKNVHLWMCLMTLEATAKIWKVIFFSFEQRATKVSVFYKFRPFAQIVSEYELH